MARRIDIRRLLAAPVLTKVHESPAIALITGLATQGMCRWLIGRGEEQRATVFGLADTDVVLVLMQKRLELASGLRMIQQEPPHLHSCEAGKHDKARIDSQTLGDGQRVATCLTWLNDDYESGETVFPEIGWRHTGKAGDSLLFLNVRSNDLRHDPLSLNADMPVTRGRRWLLTQSVRDKALTIV